MTATPALPDGRGEQRAMSKELRAELVAVIAHVIDYHTSLHNDPEGCPDCEGSFKIAGEVCDAVLSVLASRLAGPGDTESVRDEDIELVMRKHLLVKPWDDGPVLCLCDVGLTFEGPVYHRLHVVAALREAGFVVIARSALAPPEGQQVKGDSQ